MYTKVRYRYTEPKEQSRQNKLAKREENNNNINSRNNSSNSKDKIQADNYYNFFRLLLLLDSEVYIWLLNRTNVVWLTRDQVGLIKFLQKLINNSWDQQPHIRLNPSRARVLNPGKTLSNFKNFILISTLYVKNTNKDDILFHCTWPMNNKYYQRSNWHNKRWVNI